jgi:hypothetical protein
MVKVYGEMIDSLGTRWRKLTDVEIHTTTRQRWVKYEDYEEARMDANAAEVQASEQQDEIDKLKAEIYDLKLEIRAETEGYHD